MLRMASFPPDRGDIGRWFADHAREWQTGQASRFAIEHEERMIGVIDVDEGSLGYRIDRSAWGQGYPTRPRPPLYVSRVSTSAC